MLNTIVQGCPALEYTGIPLLVPASAATEASQAPPTSTTTSLNIPATWAASLKGLFQPSCPDPETVGTRAAARAIGSTMARGEPTDCTLMPMSSLRLFFHPPTMLLWSLGLLLRKGENSLVRNVPPTPLLLERGKLS